MHFFITFALILTYGLMLIFALLHVVQSLIARPTPWLGMRWEVGEERPVESLAPSTSRSMNYPAKLTTPPVSSRPNQLRGNAHARAE
jgi:hypothetical protein